MGFLTTTGRALALALLTSCATYGTRLATTPTTKGEYDGGFNVDVIISDRGVGTQLLPNPEAWIRYGLADDLDIGARFNAAGIWLDGRWSVHARERWSVTLVPGFGGGFVGATNLDTGLYHLTASGSVLLGVRPRRDWEVVLGLHAHGEFRLAAIAFRGDLDGSRFVGVPGLSLGVDIPVAGGRWRLFPGVGLYTPYDVAHGGSLPAIVQGGVGVRFD